MLTPEQVKSFISHPDVYIRRAAVEYLTDSWTQDTGVLPLILDAGSRYGFKPWADSLYRLPLTPESFRLALDYLNGTKDERAISDLNTLLSNAPADLLEEHEAALNGVSNITHDTLDDIRRRRALHARSGADLWEEVRALARKIDSGKDPDANGINLAFDITKELAGRNIPSNEEICQMLADPLAADSSLLEFVLELAGWRRLKSAVPIMIKNMESYGNYGETVASIFAQIGEPSVIAPLREMFSAADIDTRVGLSDVFGCIKHPESETAVLDLLDVEEDKTVRTFLCHSLCRLFSERGIEVVRKEIDKGYDDSIMALEEELLPVCDMLGVNLPELARWRESREERARVLEEQIAQFLGGSALPPEEAEEQDALPGHAPHERDSAVQIIRREGPKVSRNDPCPCGSGKKYKKCCGK
jgi:hypothetical protein